MSKALREARELLLNYRLGKVFTQTDHDLLDLIELSIRRAQDDFEALTNTIDSLNKEIE